MLNGHDRRILDANWRERYSIAGLDIRDRICSPQMPTGPDPFSSRH